MNAFIREQMKQGKNVQDTLDTPYQFLLDLFEEDAKPKQTQSLIQAFGG